MRLLSSLLSGARRRGRGLSSATSAPPSAPPSAPLSASLAAQHLFAIRSSTESAVGSLDLLSLSSSTAKLAAMRALVTEGHDVSEMPQPTSLTHLTKRPSDTLLKVLLPFGSDAKLRAQYINRWGMLRVGKLLEELDAFAGNVAYAFVDDGDPATGPLTLVTASFDRVDLLVHPLLANVDLHLTGMVTYAGSSSMNVDIDLCRADDGVPVIQASTTFVARSRANKAVAVPRLVPATAGERRLHAAGRSATEARKQARLASLLRQPPTAGELAMVHSLFVESQGFLREGAHGGTAPQLAKSNWVFADETSLSTAILTMPQDRNLHGKVFGGYLMRQAFEVAFAAGWRMTGELPKFLAMDDVAFLAPVETGALLTFEARCNFARGSPAKDYSVSVSATMSVPSRASAALRRGRAASATSAAVDDDGTAESPVHTLTNTFNFVFYSDDSTSVPRVFPRSYADAMGCIEAHRRLELGERLAAAREAEGGPRPRFDESDMSI